MEWPFGRWVGRLRVRAGSEREIDINYHGWLQFYGDYRSGEVLPIDPNTGQDLLHSARGEWFEYRAKFTDGRIVELCRVFNRAIPWGRADQPGFVTSGT